MSASTLVWGLTNSEQGTAFVVCEAAENSSRRHSSRSNGALLAATLTLLSSPMADLKALQRLRQLQTHVCIPAGLDGLLLVGGVDGKNHAGTREALAWLLTGLNGRNIFGFHKLDSELDEVVLLIAPDSVRLYAPAAVWAKLQPLLGRWRRLQVWTPPAEIIDDVEAVEEHKIRSFIAMVRGVRHIGVPLPASSAASGPAAAVESWPLVQSFALQDFEALTGGTHTHTHTHVYTHIHTHIRARARASTGTHTPHPRVLAQRPPFPRLRPRFPCLRPPSPRRRLLHTSPQGLMCV